MWNAIATVLLLGTSSNAMPGQALWEAIEPMCGKAYAGRMTEGTDPSDKAFADQRMVMHVSHCSDGEIRIPFHVGENRSRTWVLTRGDNYVRLKHDHRHEDGSEDEVTQYGGDAVEGNSLEMDFPADRYTAEMLPAAATNIWTIALDPGAIFSYALRRDAQGRRFKVEFDLSRPVDPPPPAW